MYKLIIGNKNFSSWSCRAWLLLKHFQIDFIEEIIMFDDPNFGSILSQYSPIKKVPILIHDQLIIPDSLAIAEYLAEQHPEKVLWPKETHAKAHARVLCATMHSGFPLIRKLMPLDVSGTERQKPINNPEFELEIYLMINLLSETKKEYGDSGEFLFGQYSIADAFFTPVASRFQTYNIELPTEIKAYTDTLLSDPAMQAWRQAAQLE